MNIDNSIITIVIIILIAIVIVLYYSFSNIGMVSIVSDIDEETYLVRDVPDKMISVNILAKIKSNMNKIASTLYQNQDSYKDNKSYIVQLYNGLKNCVISESGENTVYTSYSINKGEQIVFCLRSKLLNNKIHDFNLIMYVVLHEMAHVACPEVGHTDLFKKIFAFLATEAINMGLYTKINFSADNKEYCGLTITESII
jgi:hypothetical protein